MPGAWYMVSNMSAIRVFNWSSNFATGLEICRRTGSGVSKMGRMAMASNMAETASLSTGGRFPQLDRIILRIMDAGKASGRWVVPFGLGDDIDARAAKPSQQLIDPID